MGGSQFSFKPKENLTRAKQEQLDACLTIPHFYISIDGWRYDKEKKKTMYTVEVGLDLDYEVLIFTTEKRYSEFHKLHTSLFQFSQQRNGNLLAFPPKKMFSQFDVNFVRDRQIKLNNYVSHLSSINWVIQNQDFSNFIHYNEIKAKWVQKLLEQQALIY